MKNIAIKLLALIVVLGGIIAIVVTSQKRVERMATQTIEPEDFTSYIQRQTNTALLPVSLQDARKPFEQLYAEVKEERAIVCITSDGEQSSLIESRIADSCYSILFSAIFPKIQNYGDPIFKTSTWAAAEMAALKKDAQWLQQFEGGQEYMKDSLTHYINYVDGYHAAIQLLKNSSNCSDGASYVRKIKSAQEYEKWPWKKESGIGSDFSNKVASRAKDAWAGSISRSVDNFVKSSSSDYTDIDDLNEAFVKIDNRIKEYCRTLNQSLEKESERLQTSYKKMGEEIKNRVKY